MQKNHFLPEVYGCFSDLALPSFHVARNPPVTGSESGDEATMNISTCMQKLNTLGTAGIVNWLRAQPSTLRSCGFIRVFEVQMGGLYFT